MNTKELFVNYCGERQCVKRRHYGLINIQRILVIALKSEGEMFSEMTALVVASEQVDTGGVIQFEGEEEEETFH